MVKNSPLRALFSYFINDFPGHPDVERLTPDDFDLARIQSKEPGPIPEAEARWAWEWMASWACSTARSIRARRSTRLSSARRTRARRSVWPTEDHGAFLHRYTSAVA